MRATNESGVTAILTSATRSAARLGALRHRVPRLLVLAAAALLASCGKPGGEMPVLRVADQMQVLQSALAAAGEDKPRGYRVEWSNFFSGPPIIAAETGGSLDLGWMAETPTVFAQAARSPVKVIAVNRGLRSGASSIALVVAADAPFRSVSDLKGKRIGYLSGTIAQYLVAKVLDDAGLSLGAVQSVQLASFSQAVLRRGSVDAVTTVEPFLSQGLADRTLRVLAYGGEPNTPGFGYLVASDAALADPKRAAMIGDFIGRISRAARFVHAQPDKAAPFVGRAFIVSPGLARRILDRMPMGYAPIDDAIVARHQREADFFRQLRLIPARVDAAKLFDRRYNRNVAITEREQ